MVNELIKTPKQVKSIARKAAVADCVVAQPFYYSDSSVEELVFSRMSFCEEFTLKSITNNKVILMEDCVFHKPVHLDCIKNVKIVIRNCHFKDDLEINNLECGTVELFGTSHNSDALLLNIKVDTFFTSDVAMKKQNMIQLVNATVARFVSH